jgi:hypothetical protein
MRSATLIARSRRAVIDGGRRIRRGIKTVLCPHAWRRGIDLRRARPTVGLTPSPTIRAVAEDLPGRAGEEPNESDQIRALAYQRSLERLSAQREDLERMRTRSNAELTLAAAAAALLAGAGFTGVGEGQFTADWRLWVGLGIVGVIALLHFYVVYARNWYFHMDATTILQGYADTGMALSDTHHWLATYNSENAHLNDLGLARVSKTISVAALLLVVEIAFLAWFLASNV